MKKGINNFKDIYVLLIVIAIILQTVSATANTNTPQGVSSKSLATDYKNTDGENNINETIWSNIMDCNILYEAQEDNEQIIRFDEIFNELPPSENNDLFIERENSKFTPGEFIVKFKRDKIVAVSKPSDGYVSIGIPTIDALNEKHQVNLVEELFPFCGKKPEQKRYLHNIFKMNVPQDSNIQEIAHAYSSDPNVEYAEPNYIFNLCNIPNDTNFSDQWALNNSGQTNGTIDADIDAPEAWDLETGDSDVIIAILDTGVNYTHVDLADNIWINTAEDINSNGQFDNYSSSEGGDEDGIDNDGNNFTDDVIGWDFLDNDNDPEDYAGGIYTGHGTHCSGIASAVGNNEVGAVGVCWNCTIMPIRCVLGVNSTIIFNGIQYAVDNGAHVISMSFGESVFSELMEDAVDYAYSQGAVLVAAAGNYNMDDKILYPAAYENVTAVAATNHNDLRSYHSSFGTWVDIAAPGKNILSTIPGDIYGEKSGTSMATPHVAGLAALILSEYANRSLDPDEVKSIILDTADDMLYYEMNIGRRINAYKAMMYYTARARVERPSNWTNINGTINITGSMWANNFQYYRVMIGSGKTPDSWTLLTNSTTAVNGTITSLNTTSYSEGLYKIRLEVVCDEGIVEDATWIVINNEYNLLTVDDDGGEDYILIQDAIDNAGTGDTVYVYSGTYTKGIFIDRAINLTGENKTKTFIDTSSEEYHYYHGVTITMDGVNVSGFTIQNCLKPHKYAGIRILSNNNKIYDNIFTKNNCPVIHLENSNNNTIIKNDFFDNNFGLESGNSSNNNISRNNFQDNSKRGINIDNIFSSENIIYHNSFINNNNGGEQAYDKGDNNWDNGYPSGGNYWYDYTGDDSYSGPNQNISGGDGIGDTPYNISGGTNQDRYPKLDITSPKIVTNNNNPSIVGFGFNVTFIAYVTDPIPSSGIKTVKVNITKPDKSTENFTMDNTWYKKYEYVFNGTWLVGQYNYTIWVVDNENNTNSSTGNSFNVSGQATISVSTIKDSYGDNETVNITDPPVYEQKIGYKLIDNNSVLHMWNEYNSYYFNTSSGIQLTNHYDEYWSHNVLMLGYYNNDEWNLIYRTDELSGFNKNISTDNETFVNATLWKNLSYGGYDFRLAIRYHLGVNDSDLAVMPYIKNLGQAIPYTLGFGWEIKDIKIANTYENDSIRLFNGTDWVNYPLNQTLNNKYTDMDYNTTFILEGRNEGKYFRRTLYLKWNHALDYLVKVKSRTGQYNAPVTLFIKVGTLAQNQEKYTKMNWLDSDDWLGVSSSELATACEYKLFLGMALDGIDMWAPSSDHDHEFILDLGQQYSIKKFRGRSESTLDPTDVDIYISNDNSTWGTAVASDISTWQDTSSWVEVNSTDKEGRYIKVVVQATEDANRRLVWGLTPLGTIFDAYGDVVTTSNNPPEISNPYPANGSIGISITPTLNITVTDADGDTMNITWLSNSSGSWQIFDTNNSIGNSTYHQTFSNATVNGQWWYWKVNVTDGTDITESSVYKFYTGYPSKIENTGSYSIKGYLLIQVHYHNLSSMWAVADNTINEDTPRTIHLSDQYTEETNVLALDTIFNGLVNTSNLSSYGNGTYRIYAAFRDPDGNILKCDDDTELVATYEFDITFD